MEEKPRFTRETLNQFQILEEVAMFATTKVFPVIPARKVALAVIGGNVLKSVSTIDERAFMDLSLDWPSINTRTV